MKTTRLVAAVLVTAVALLADAPRGTVPMSSAEKYAAHAEQQGDSIGATLLTPSQTKKVFSTDLDRCCKVIEVALYPKKDGMLEVSLNDFALRIVGQEIATKPSSPELVAGRLQRRAEPKETASNKGTDVVISPSGGIGYETGGIDPVTGQPRRGGVVTSAGVGVGVGRGGSPPPKPESTDADRRTMELELREKGLPPGNTASAVAGYLYFSMPQKKNVKYQLEYNLNGSKVVLPL
ncbi:MAG TPA: hypothetical protein VF532_00145 [Candidatus Angelobacter sp.]